MESYLISILALKLKIHFGEHKFIVSIHPVCIFTFPSICFKSNCQSETAGTLFISDISTVLFSPVITHVSYFN